MSDYTSKLIHVASSDALSASVLNKADFEVDLQAHLGINKTVRITLKSCIFPNVFPNITTGVDDIFKFQETGQVAQSITIAQGFYTATELASALQTAINLVLVAGSVAITINTNTLKFIFTFTSTTASILTSAAGNTMAPRIGVIDGATDVAAYTSEVAMSLQGLTEVFLVSKNVAPSNMIRSLGTVIHTVTNIPITAPFGGMNVFNSQDDELTSITYKTPRDLRFVDFKLTDRNGTTVNLDNQNLKVCFMVYYE